jgi:hypothetical protein
MPQINLGVSFNEAKTEGEKQMLKLTPGVYKIVVKEVKVTESSKGNPQLQWTYEVVENQNSDFNGKQLMNWTPLPHNGNVKGIGFIVSALEAIGMTYDGQGFDTDQCVGLTCHANVIVDEKKYNKIASFVV